MKKKPMYEGILKLIREQSVFREAEKILDYYLMSSSEVSYLPDDEVRSLYAVAIPGGSEGIYIDVIAETKECRMQIMTLKTLQEGVEAFAIMGKLAGIITWAAYRVWYQFLD